MFQMIFVSSGLLVFEFRQNEESVTKPLNPGDVLILRHGSSFRLSSPETGYGGVCYLDHDPTDPQEYGDSFSFHSSDWISELVGLMQFAIAHPETFSGDTLALLGRTIAWHAIEERTTRGEHHATLSRRWTERVRHVVQSTLYAGGDEFRAGIEALDLSYRQLARHFQANGGISIKQYQIAERVREAKLHYPSSQKFATQFKRVTGMTPREYRAG